MYSKEEMKKLGKILVGDFIGKIRREIIIDRKLCVGDKVLPCLCYDPATGAAVAVLTKVGAGYVDISPKDKKRARKMADELAKYIVSEGIIRVDMATVSFHDIDGATVCYMQGLYECEVEGDE